jgi:CRP/FNR family transcriptional regulator, cyclic AMP receptor protein
VARGRFVATIDSPVTGQAAAVNIFEPNSLFGELSLLGRTVRSATISALNAAETLELQRPDFEQLLADHPDIQRFLLVALAERVREMTTQLSEALFVPVEKRVRRRLVLLDEVARAAGEEWIVLRQEDVATMAGTTRPTVNRVLRRAQVDGIIELARGRMRVQDRARLERLAH